MAEPAHVCTVLSYHCEAVTAFWTIMLSLITLGLAIATFRLYQATVNLAKDAKQSADAVPKLERAYVMVTAECILSLDGTGRPTSLMKVTFTNHGRTPALINRIRAYRWDDDKPPQELIQHEVSQLQIPPGLVIAQGDDRAETIEFALAPALWEQMERREKFLYCVGEIEYMDVLGNTRLTSFCWNYVKNKSLQITPDTKLNYFT